MHTSQYSLRPYASGDQPACLALFDGNTPEFFAPVERGEFAEFLAAPRATMLVAQSPDAEIIACGGYYLREGGTEGGLAWGMVARAWHLRGVGRMLLRARLEALRLAGARVVSVRTSQHSRGFFEREGFTEVRIVPDGFVPGINMVELMLRTLP